jgi:branched chain amino acid efflux pump
MSGPWIAVLVTSAGCYALKLAGLTIPERLLGNPWLRRFAELVPVALLAALVAVEAVAKGSALVFDPARLAGLAAAVVALLLRAPFLVVIIAAAAVAAVLRLAGVA